MVAICCQCIGLRKYWGGWEEAEREEKKHLNKLMIAFVLESRFQNISPVLQEQKHQCVLDHTRRRHIR